MKLSLGAVAENTSVGVPICNYLLKTERLSFKVLVAVQIRAAKLSSSVMFYHHCFIPLSQTFHARAPLWFAVWSRAEDPKFSCMQPNSKFPNIPTFTYFQLWHLQLL